MIESALNFLISLLPWHPTFDPVALAFTAAYVVAQLMFCLSLRRLAMHIPGPERMCNPLGLWVLAIPGIGAIASFAVLRHMFDAATAATEIHHVAPPRRAARAFAMTYGISRLLIFVPGLLIPALLLQSFSATGFLLRLTAVARSLRTPDVAIA
jgi:hypothetical protein